VAALAAAPALAGALLSEAQARAAAVKILRGDPYGRSASEVLAKIKETEFQRVGGTTVCGATRPYWRFHVVAVLPDQRIDGDLILDARSGAMICANLPLLD
jgi:hypothetical protein